MRRIMNMVSKFAGSSGSSTGRRRPAMASGMGTRANTGGAGTRGRSAAGGGGIESLARRVLRKAR